MCNSEEILKFIFYILKVNLNYNANIFYRLKPYFNRLKFIKDLKNSEEYL